MRLLYFLMGMSAGSWLVLMAMYHGNWMGTVFGG